MSLQSESNNTQYEIMLFKQSRSVYIIGLAIISTFLLINFVVVGIWIKRKNQTLLQIFKLLIKRKHSNKFDDEVTSIFNPSKKLLKRQISIQRSQNQHKNQSKYSKISNKNIQKEANQSKFKLKSLDSILFQEVNNLHEITNDKIQLGNISKINSFKGVRNWMESITVYQPFLIIFFLLGVSKNSFYRPKTQEQFMSTNNGTLTYLGVILMMLSLLLYLFINCSKIIFELLNFFDQSKAKVSPLQEQSGTCSNLNKKLQMKKQIKLKSSKFITCNGIQTQISIHQNQLERFAQQQEINKNNQKQTKIKQTKNKLSGQIQNLYYIFDVAYLIPLIISILIIANNMYQN